MELNQIKGLGPKRIEILKKAGIKDPVDLLYCFPYEYLSEKNMDLENLNDGDIALLHCSADGFKFNYISKSLNITSANAISDDGKNIIKLKWFNQYYIKNSFTCNQKYWIYGQLKINVKERYILNPKKIAFDNPIIPLYKNISGINGSLVSSAIKTILEDYTVKTVFSGEIIEKYGLKNLNEIFMQIHFPTDIENAIQARSVLALYHLTLQIAAFRASQPNKDSKRTLFYSNNIKKLDESISKLSFELTNEQRQALNDIIISFHSDKTTNLLLQGDVGCGKTIVALLAMYYVYLSGYQSVLMAPTEILCEQHFNTALFFEKFGVKTALLTGSQNKTSRQQILFDIKHKNVDFIIATHSILNEEISFASLGLVVTDEQQRFGVAQRAFLKKKSSCDFLTLTATPIPRSLAMVMYGELQQTVISSKPLSRPKIKTSFVKTSKLKSMYEYFLQKAENGEKTYIVCPRIDSDEEGLTSCLELYQSLNKTAMKKYLGLLHGRMSDQEKNDVMLKFLHGDIRILISTTIIEVGIDIKDATAIAIFDPERYGLSQLHQLRGRVGRGTLESYCFLITDTKTERLNIFAENNDGFVLAEYDLKTRGAGDFIGLKQHGKTEIMKNITIDVDMIKRAGSIAKELLNSESFMDTLKSSLDNDFEEIILN